VNPDQLFAHLKQLTKTLGPRQVGLLVVVFVAVVGIVVGSAYWMSAPNFALLASDLDAESASALVSHLKDVKVPYEITDGGRTVRVPAERVDELRLDVAGTGLPSAGRVGFEIFDRPAFGTTEFLEQVNFRRALEGELGRTIGTLSDVSSARVHIAMGKDSLFADKSEPAKASVVLRLKNDRPLAPATVKAITGLVANSVESLRPESVVVLDTFGRSLTPSGTEGDDATGTIGLDRQQRIERDMSGRVVALLEPIVGSGHVRVNVSARLRAEAEDVTEEKWDPTPVIRSKQTVNESDSRALASGGAAGARANLPPGTSLTPPAVTAATLPAPTPSPTVPGAEAAPAAGTGAPAAPPLPAAPATVGSTKTSETTNYEIGRLTSHRTNPSGQVARLSVAVIVDEERPPVAAGSGTVSTPKPRPAEELQRLQKLVAAAVGYDEARGDQLTVDSIAFDTPPEPEATPEPSGLSNVWDEVRTQVRDNGLSALRTVAVLIVALVAIFGFLRPMAKKALTAPPTPAALPAATTGGARLTTVQELEGRGDDGGPDNKTRPLLARRVAQLAADEPEYVARIMRTWLTDEES
jgi:flagellar M-ring protein FliF